MSADNNYIFNTQEALRRTVQQGQPPNGIKPIDCGPYLDVVQSVYEAYDREGKAGAERAFVALANDDPQLYELIAGEDIEHEPWQIFTLSDAYQLRPPTQYIVSGILPLPSLSIVYGPPGTMKSLFVMDMMTCVSAGLAWLEPLPNSRGQPIAVKQSPSLWIDLDNGSRIMHERFEALGKARDLNPKDTPLSYVSMPDPWLAASDDDSMTALKNRALRMDVKLIVIDNLGVILGDIEENSGQMGNVMGKLRKLAEDTGAAIVILHHQRKSVGTTARAGDSLRGHSSIEAALDLALKVQREAGSGLISIESTKTRGVDVPKIEAQFSYTHKSNTTDLETAKFYGLNSDNNMTDNGIKQLILEAVTDNPLVSQRKLATLVQAMYAEDEVKPGFNRIRGLIQTLVSEEKIEATSEKEGKSSGYKIVGSEVQGPLL